jgi:type VI secretion system protein ImpH
MLRALVGLGTDGLTERLAVPDRAILRCAGLFALRPRSAAGLRTIISAYFGVSVRVQQFVGRWREIEPEDQTRLGERHGSNVLGESAVLGTRVWDQPGAIRVILGPLSGEQYRDFLPTGSALRPLRDLVQLYVGPDLDVEFELVLRASDTPAAKLDRSPDAALGWTSWLGMPQRTAHPQVSVRAEAS